MPSGPPTFGGSPVWIRASACLGHAEIGVMSMSVVSQYSSPDLGNACVRVEHVSLAVVRRVAAMLGLDATELGEGADLPQGWHFILMAADTPRKDIRSDGFPGLGVPLPDLGLPRVVLGGREVKFHNAIPIGSTVYRTSSIGSVQQKQGHNGPMAIVTINHELKVSGSDTVALEEQQTYVLLGPTKPQAAPTAQHGQTAEIKRSKTIVPDDTLLFQYSALGFNSHKIHLDRHYATSVEGYPDLVVNGGLINVIMTDFLRLDRNVGIKKLKTRHFIPAYANQALTLTFDEGEEKHLVRALNEGGADIAQMEVVAS
jgi:3-methylfumaryl-CoA hydratase